jgi:fido (protein-threonine AMPylation protein)
MYDYICETEETNITIFTLLKLNRMLYQYAAYSDDIESMNMTDFIDEVLKVHHRITIIHPFRDGNGRTSRVFLNWLFKLKGIPPVYIKAEKKQEYFDALRDADLNNDYTKLREVFHVDNLQKNNLWSICILKTELIHKF